jgi:uncharacterized protein (TIGR02145 family)
MVGTVRAELLWQDRNPTVAGEVVKKNSISVINAGKRDEAYIYAEAGVPGNAVIAMWVDKNGDGTFDVMEDLKYWSFHIWVTEYNPYEAAGQKLYIPSGVSKGTIFMDRNLGALNNKWDIEGEARGLYYQYGRNVPFPRSPGWGNGDAGWTNGGFECYDLSGTLQIISSGVIGYSPPWPLPPLDEIQRSLINPLTFYTNGKWPFLDDDPYLWSTKGGNKTAFDPCPEGWRIPKHAAWGGGESPWYELDYNNLEKNKSNYDNGRYHAAVGYYPFAGYITENKVIAVTSSQAYYWTSYSFRDTQHDYGTGLYIDNTDTGVDIFPQNKLEMRYGASVRCVVDANYLQNKPGGGLFRNSAGNMKDKIKP